MKHAWRQLCRFVTAWDRDRWELVVLSIPLARGLLAAVQLAPAQLSGEVVNEPWQIILLTLLSVGAFAAIIGVLKDRPIVERTALSILGPIAVIYGLASLVSDPTRGTVGLIVYSMIAACCFARSREITRAMRITNRMLGVQADEP